jgi:hypothetical protein
MRAIIIKEARLEERFLAFVDKMKLQFRENKALEESLRQELERSFVYQAYQLKREILEDND